MSKKENRIKNLPFLGFLLVAFFACLRAILYFNQLQGRAVYFYSDDAIYAILAQRFLRGDFLNAFNPYWNAGFPLATIPFYLLTGQWETAQILVSMASSVLLIFVSYLTLRKISHSLAILTAFLIAFSPALERLTLYWGITEPLYILLFWLAVYFGWEAIKTQKISRYLIAGIFFGFAYLVRTEAIFAMAIFVVIAAGSFLLQKKKKISSSWPGLLMGALAIPSFLYFRSARGIFFAACLLTVFLFSSILQIKKNSFWQNIKQFVSKVWILILPFIFINLPYFITISINLQKPTLSGKYAYLTAGHAFTPEERYFTTFAQEVWSIDFPNYNSSYYESERMLKALWRNLDNSLEATWGRLGTNFSFYGSDNIFTNLDVNLALTGLIFGVLQANVGLFVLYLVVIWLASFFYVSFFMEAAFRYLAFSFPILLLGEALTIWTIAKALKRINPVLFSAPLIVFAIFFFNRSIDKTAFTTIPQVRRYEDQKMLGEWLNAHGIKLFMGRTEGIGFYADAKMVYVPSADPETIVQFAKAWGVEYILSRPHESSWDYMVDMVDPEFQHPDLNLIHSFDDGSLVWKIGLTEEEKQDNLRTGKHIFREIID